MTVAIRHHLPHSAASSAHRARQASTQTRCFDGLTVALQGLGHVGYDYARRLHAAGAKLVVADIDQAALKRAQDELGAEVVGIDAIYDVQADIYAPCALGATLNPDTLSRLKAKIVARCGQQSVSHCRYR